MSNVPILPSYLSADVLERHTVLIVDDERCNLMVARAVLEKFSIRTASDGAEAVAIMQAEPVSVLVADHRMPNMSGVELCEWAMSAYPGTQRLLLTAFADPAVTIDAINRGGVDRFLTKPCPNETLQIAVSEAVARAELELVVKQLRNDLQRSERDAAAATLQQLVLHDLANVAMSLEGVSSELTRWIERPEVSAPVAVKAEMGIFKSSLENLRNLHDRARENRPGSDRAPTPHRVKGAIEAAIMLMRLHSGGGVRIRVVCPDDVEILADRLDVSRVLVNLLSNAIQAITESGRTDGEVELSVERVGDKVAIAVGDNGPGIPEALRSDVFRMGWTSRHGRGGSGLGLAICRTLAEANGGGIALANQTPGAKFVVTLPSPSEVAHGP